MKLNVVNVQCKSDEHYHLSYVTELFESKVCVSISNYPDAAHVAFLYANDVESEDYRNPFQFDYQDLNILNQFSFAKIVVHCALANKLQYKDLRELQGLHIFDTVNEDLIYNIVSLATSNKYSDIEQFSIEDLFMFMFATGIGFLSRNGFMRRKDYNRVFTRYNDAYLVYTIMSKAYRVSRIHTENPTQSAIRDNARIMFNCIAKSAEPVTFNFKYADPVKYREFEQRLRSRYNGKFTYEDLDSDFEFLNDVTMIFAEIFSAELEMSHLKIQSI